jgi:hypothetical protein
MGDEVKDELVDEESQLKAQLDAIKRAEQPPPPEEAKAAEPIPPAEPPVETTPETKPESAAAPPAKAEEQPPAKRDGAAWKLLRQRERELEEARAELARRQALENKEPAKEPTFDDQPADYLKARIERTEAELARVRSEEQRRDYIEGIKRQEESFVREKPDYYKATQYLIDKDIKQWQRAGLATVHTNQVLQAARSNDPRLAGYKDQLKHLKEDAGVVAYAEKEGIDPEEAAAFVIARDTWLTTRRDLLAEGAKAQGRSVAEVAYEEAVDRGWNGNPQDGKTPEQEAAARARVQQAKEVSAATHSLSDSATADAAQEVRVLKSRQQVLDLDDATLDNLIASGKYRELN